MNTKRVWDNLAEVKHANETFLQIHEKEIQKLVSTENKTEEELLDREMLIELVEKIARVNQIIDYISMEPGTEGVLSREKSGMVCWNGRPVPPMQEFEVLIYSKSLDRKAWTRTFVTMPYEGSQPFLAGLDKRLDINGVKARFRIQTE